MSLLWLVVPSRTIYYKDEFFEDFDDEEREFIVSHEILHIVLSHTTQ